MELNELKALMAASILSGSIICTNALTVKSIDDREIVAAVKIAQKIWEEVLKQERD